MQFYSKLITAIVGLLIIIGTRYGFDLAESQQLIVDALTAIVTAIGVYSVRNKPTTDDQVDVARETTNAAAAKIRDE